MVASKYCDSTPRSQVNLSHDSSRARRAVGRACELPLGSATEAPFIRSVQILRIYDAPSLALWAMSWWGLLAGGVFSPWIYGQREGWKEGLNHLYCPTYSRGPFIRSVQNIANRYCTECIIGIVQNAGTPSRFRFARTRRDEG